MMDLIDRSVREVYEELEGMYGEHSGNDNVRGCDGYYVFTVSVHGGRVCPEHFLEKEEV